MKKVIKEKDLICSHCASIYPFKINREYTRIKGFKYAYCFKCKKMTRHQTIDPIDLYIKELESKDPEEYTEKDRILKRALTRNNH